MSKAVNGKTKLKRHNPVGFIISVILFIALVGASVGGTIAAVSIGNNALETRFGVSALDLLACLDDLTTAEEGVVTNPYDKEDTAKFYTALDSALFLKEGTVTEEYINDAIGGSIGLSTGGSEENGTQTQTTTSADEGVTDGGSGTDFDDHKSDSAAESLMSIIKRENFDAEALGAYDTTRTDNALPVLTDREMAAFVNTFTFESGRLDELAGSAFENYIGDTPLSEILSLEQLKVRRGSDLSDEDKLAFEADDDGVYMSVTISVDITSVVKSAIGSISDEKLGMLASAFLPAKVYITASVDLTDASDNMKFGINRMAQETCKMHYITEEMNAKYGENGITKFERLRIIVESFSGQDIITYAEQFTNGVTDFICKGGDNEYAFADLIDLTSVRVNEDGAGEFAVDAYGMLAGALRNAMDNESVTKNDIISVMQTLICTDATDGIDGGARVDLYTPDLAALEAALPEAGLASVADIDSDEDIAVLAALGVQVVKADPGQTVPEGWVNVCSDLTKDGVFEAFGVSDPTDKYTFDDIVAIMQAGDDPSGLTQTQKELYAEITESAGTSTGEFALEITDKMLGSTLRDMTDTLGESVSSYGVSVHSVRLTKSGGTDYADIVVSVDVGKLTEGASGYIGGVLPEYISLGVRVDVTPNRADAERAGAVWTTVNGAKENGGTPPVEELTCGSVITSIERIVPGIKLDGMLSAFTSGINAAITNMTDVLGDFRFVASN